MGSSLDEEDFAMGGTLLQAELPSGSLRSVYARVSGADVARGQIHLRLAPRRQSPGCIAQRHAPPSLLAT